MAAESSTTRISDSIPLLTPLFIGLSLLFVRSFGKETVGRPPAAGLMFSCDPPIANAGARFEPPAIASGNRRGFSEPARSQTRDARREIRFPTARPHSQVAGARHSPAARHLRAQPGVEPLGLFALLPDREPGERRAAFLLGVPGRPAVAHLHGFART